MDLREALNLTDEELVSFVGAGGKKTAMRRLVDEGTDRSVAYTTTTHMPPPPKIPLVLLTAPALLSMRRRQAGPISLAAGSVDDPERASTKVRGFAPETIDRLAERKTIDWILVKADGARRRELTAPATHEPAIPRQSTVVVVVASVAAVGRPLDNETAHRPERVAHLAGTELGDVVTAETVATVLSHPDGGRKAIPGDARAVVLVNKADDSERHRVATEIVDATRSRTDRYDVGLVSSFRSESLDVIFE